MVKVLRITNDTNVWLSAQYFQGKPSQIVHLIEEKKIISVISNFILNEIREKMIVKFETPAFAANATISYIRSISEVVYIANKTYTLRDPKDNPVLETAINGKCDFLITGDKDLLILKKYNNINIVTPAQFLNIYKR